MTPKVSRHPPKYVACFDESFDKVSYSKQMDIHTILDEMMRN